MKVDKKYIYIDKEIVLNDTKVKNKIEINIENIEILQDFINKNNKKYKYINYNLQTEDVIIRNIENINIKKKKEIIGQIKYEIIKYMPININKYELKYKILNKENDIASIQVILFPKYIITLCKEISKVLGLKIKNINVNFDNVQKLLQQKLIYDIKENSIILELRKNEILLNKVIKNKILESYIVPKNLSVISHINSLDEKINDIYTYGNEVLDMKSISINSGLNIRKIKLNETNKKIIISSELNQEINRYINTIGTVI